MSTLRFSVLGSLIFAFLAAPVIAWACGGFFAADPVVQTGERIIFTVNGDETITAVIGISYSGAAADFSWVLPVPAAPVVEVAETTDLVEIDFLTRRRFIAPPEVCAGVVPTGGFGGGGFTMGAVGPYEYVVIDNDDPDQMVNWLRDNGYPVAAEAEPIIASYVEMGMQFLAMKLAPEFGTEDIQPVKLTMPMDAPMIPIRIASVASVETLPIQVWIFADQQYAPANWAHPTPDFTRLRGPSRWQSVVEAGGPSSAPARVNYAGLLTEIQAEHDGLAFVTEYAQPTSSLGETSSDLINGYIERFPYVTRLYAQLSPAQMTLDPLFAPAPDLPDVAREIVISDYVDPFHYHGCGTRELAQDDLNDFPIVRSLPPDADALRAEFGIQSQAIPHPEGWVFNPVSQVYAGYSPAFYIVAPQPVTADALQAALDGTLDHPVLIVGQTESYYGDFSPRPLSHVVFPEASGSYARAALPGLHVEDLAVMNPPFYPFNYTWTMVALLTPEADWDASQALYRALLNHFSSHRYRYSDTLPNTLFVGLVDIGFSHFDTQPENFGYLVAFPDGWVERSELRADPARIESFFAQNARFTDQTITAVIAPETAQPGNPQARLLPLPGMPAFDSYAAGRVTPAMRDWLTAIGSEYGLPLDALIDIERDYGFCATYKNADPLVFERDGRRGYLRIDQNIGYTPYLVEATVDADHFDAYEATLYAIAASFQGTLDLGCG